MTREWSIQTSLLLLVAAIVAPLVGLEVYSIWQEARTSAERAEQSAMSVAQAAAGGVEQLLLDVDTVLAAVAGWERTVEPDAATCNRHLRETKTVLPQLHHLTVVDTTGTIRCTTLTDEDPAVLPGTSDRAWFQEVMATGDFVVSKPVVGKISGLWVSVLARPIGGADGRISGAVVTSVDLAHLHRILNRIPMPGGGLLTLSHADGTVVARTRNTDEWIGRRLPGSERPDTVEGGITDQELLEGPGINRARTGEGEEVLFAWVPIPESQWVLYAGFPLNWVYGPVWTTARSRGFVLLGVLALGLVVTLGLYGRISGALRRLISDTRAAAEGIESRVREHGPTEVREVARQFNRTLEARMKAEDDLRTAQERMRQRQKMEAVGRLAGGVAHDFNNLLTVIQGEASLLTDEGVEEGERRKGLDEIMRASERAAELVQNLLTFSRQDQGRPRSLDPNRIVRQMEKVIRSLAGEKVEVTLDLGPDVPRVEADPSQLEQVLMNLVVNARDAMPDGGRLEIRTADLEVDGGEASESDSGLQPGRYATLTVSDDGMGMSPEVRSRIFEPFYTTKERAKGTGLGLSSVYGIVTGWGGQVGVESDPGEGATFTVYLPASLRTTTGAGTRAGRRRDPGDPRSG